MVLSPGTNTGAKVTTTPTLEDNPNPTSPPISNSTTPEVVVDPLIMKTVRSQLSPMVSNSQAILQVCLSIEINNYILGEK